MPSDHSFWLTDELEEVAIERCLNDTIVELNYQHVLFVPTKSLRDQLTRLNLVIVVPLLELDMLGEALIYLLTCCMVLCRYHTDIAAENVESLLAYVCITIFIITSLMVL